MVYRNQRERESVAGSIAWPVCAGDSMRFSGAPCRTGAPHSGADCRIFLNEAPVATCSSSATSCRRCRPGSQPSKTLFGVNDVQNK